VSLFKYFSKLDYANQFLDGKVFCQTASYFRDYEDAEAKQIIGDEYEGTLLYHPAGGLQVSNVTNGTAGPLQMGMECLVKGQEIFIFCLSRSFNDVLIAEFKAVVCVEICRPQEFISRWQKALPEAARSKEKHVARRVKYYNREDVPGNVWALPDLIITAKLKQFEYQKEFRLAYTSTDAFGFENCDYRLVNRVTRPLPKPEEHRRHTLELGDLRNMCRVHDILPHEK
jgi:hypothetical protein